MAYISIKERYVLDVLKWFGMVDSNAMYSLFILGSKLHNNKWEVKVDETYLKQIVGSPHVSHHHYTSYDVYYEFN